MDSKEIALELNSILEFVDCDVCPLRKACDMQEEGVKSAGDTICNVLSKKIGCEE